MLIRCILSLAIVIGTAAPAFAKTTVIAQLGTAPLLGSSSSSKELIARVERNEGILSAAGDKIGLTAAQYAQFRAAIMSSRVAWVKVPRHLDAMSWRGGSRVYVIRDVMIPAGTQGWEVDIPDGKQILAVYMPALCGNLSILRKQAPAIAQRPPTRVLGVTAVAPPVAAVPAPPVEASPALAADVPPAVAVVPVAPPVVAAGPAFPPVAAVRHGFGLLPLLLGAAALVGATHSGPNSGPLPISNPGGAPIVPIPTCP